MAKKERKRFTVGNREYVHTWHPGTNLWQIIWLGIDAHERKTDNEYNLLAEVERDNLYDFVSEIDIVVRRPEFVKRVAECRERLQQMFPNSRYTLQEYWRKSVKASKELRLSDDVNMALFYRIVGAARDSMVELYGGIYLRDSALLSKKRFKPSTGKYDFETWIDNGREYPNRRAVDKKAIESLDKWQDSKRGIFDSTDSLLLKPDYYESEMQLRSYRRGFNIEFIRGEQSFNYWLVQAFETYDKELADGTPSATYVDPYIDAWQ